MSGSKEQWLADSVVPYLSCEPDSDPYLGTKYVSLCKPDSKCDQ